MNSTVRPTTIEKKYDSKYYLKSGVSGGICCLYTHVAVVPIDVVKTKIQLEPTKYNKGMSGTFQQLYKTEGIKSLTTG
jgi:solute carrier family 25 (mitochondrial phosphate transporter), member 3